MSREMVVAMKRATEPYESKQAIELELAGKLSENFSRGRAFYNIAVLQVQVDLYSKKQKILLTKQKLDNLFLIMKIG
jgi:hypothetical protein